MFWGKNEKGKRNNYATYYILLSFRRSTSHFRGNFFGGTTNRIEKFPLNIDKSRFATDSMVDVSPKTANKDEATSIPSPNIFTLQR